MKNIDRPSRFVIPFAQDDSARVEVPETSPDPARFSQSLGSPPVTGLPREAGGKPPQLEDFNGAMNQVGRVAWWALLGGRFPFDATWVTNPRLGGYPRGAVVPAALGAGAIGLGEWYNNADDNVANPDTVGTGWVPGYNYGATALTGVTGGTVTLTPAQAAKVVISISGALTSNLVLIVPAWVYRWTFYNRTSGGFTVTIKNAATAGVTIPQDGQAYDVRCDGTAVSRVDVLIPSASTTTAGVVRLTLVPEAAAGASDTIAVTPAALKPLLDEKFNVAGGNVTGPTTFLGQVSTVGSEIGGPRFIFRDAINSVTRYYQTHSNATWSLNTAQDDGSFAGLLLSFGRTSRNAQFGAQVSAIGGFKVGSSRTIKDHVAYITPEDGLQQVLALSTVLYRYKRGGRVRVGYYAEDVEQVIPEAVCDGDPEVDQSPLLLEHDQMLPAHTAAIQALHALLADALARIKALEGK